MEDKSDLVTIGKLIDENSYKREQKHIDIDNTINIDFIGNKGTIHEVKKSDGMESADLFQVKYYLYYLHKRGVEDIEGVINYPKLKQKVNVKLGASDIKEIEALLEKIKKILGLDIPPPIKKTKVCKQCAYFELCYI